MSSPVADDKNAAKERNYVADQQNWEQRVRSELESAQKWNENWGVLFSRGIPNDYEKRISYLQEELKKFVRLDIHNYLNITFTLSQVEKYWFRDDG